MTIRYLFIIYIFLFFISCKKTTIQNESPIIMKIGTTTLTEKNVSDAIGEHATPEQKLNYIQNWSNKELAYQAALENGLDKEENTKKIIEDMCKNLLSAQFIQQEVGKSGTIEVFADEIEKEFQQNPHTYIRKEPVIRAAKIATETKTSAWKARDGLTVQNFRTRGNYLSLDTILPFDSIKFTPKSNFTPDVFNTIFNAKTMSITLPISENGKYSVYLILDKADAGTPANLEEVIDEVKHNISVKKQNKIVGSIYENLRNRYDYSYNREYITRLENQQKTSVQTEQEQK